MSLLTTLGPSFRFAFDPADGRYAVSASFPPQYPFSAVRDQHHVRPRPTSRSSFASSASFASSSSSSSSRTYDRYPLTDMREVSPGMLASGQLTENHPLVNTYLDALARIMPRAPSKSSSSSLTSPTHPSHHLPTTLLATPTPQPAPVDITHWLANHAGIASILTLSNVISQQFQLFPTPVSRLYASEVPNLSERQKEAILALAALKVLNHPEHPAHFALWGKNILKRTAHVVDTVLQSKPCPIASRVGWIGLAENVWALEGLQSIYIPPPPQVHKKSPGMTLRKRKAALAAAASLAHTAGEVLAGSPPRKRTRTTRASQRAKDAQAAQPVHSAPDNSEVPGDEQSTSLLFSFPTQQITQPFVMPTTPTLELISRAVKEEYITSSPVLQAIELMLGLTDTTALDSAISLDPLSAQPAPRRSTRARRKPALPGTPSLLASPLSTPSLSPSSLPAPEKRPRSHSRGSSTAVSDGGYPSEEGTVIDFGAVPGKRKAVELEVLDLVEVLQSGPIAKVKKSKARVPARKRTKVEEASAAFEDTALPGQAEFAISEVDGKVAVSKIAPIPAAKKRRASSGKRKAARRS